MKEWVAAAAAVLALYGMMILACRILMLIDRGW